MKRIRLLGTALIAIFALGAITAATASAETEWTKILPIPTPTAPDISHSKQIGTGKLEVGTTKVECAAAQDLATFTSANLGTFDALFEKCKAEGLVACTGEGDAKETIGTAGTVHYWLALLKETSGSKLVAALVYLLKTVKFECLGKAITVIGCVAAEATPTEKLTSTTKDIFRNDILSVLPQETTKEIDCKTLTKVASEEFKESSQTGEDENEKFEQEGKSITVLLMDLKTEI